MLAETPLAATFASYRRRSSANFASLPKILILRAKVVELLREHEVGVGALEPDEPGELAGRRVGDEIELAPQLVELAPPGLIQNQVVERTIVAEVPGALWNPALRRRPVWLRASQVDVRSDTRKAAGNTSQNRSSAAIAAARAAPSAGMTRAGS